jgi:4-alpha-glucanotransferase
MAEAKLMALARAAGLAVDWTDAAGRPKTVGADTLRAVLSALKFPAANDRQTRDSLSGLKQAKAAKQSLLVVKAGSRLALPRKGRTARLSAEDGRVHDLKIEQERVTLPREPGYYQLDDGQLVAIVPARAWLPQTQLWGIGVQTYALRGGSSRGFGDFAALREFCEDAAQLGVGAVAISPVHALFGAVPEHISPYAPSTRLWLNPLYAALPRTARDDDARLVDWPVAAREKWRRLRAAFARMGKNGDFDNFVRQGGERLLAHARFEVLDARFRAQGCKNWREWPEEYSDATRPAVRRLAPKDADVAFQLFLQWQADTGLAEAQASAVQGGMPIGLITDMAVGMDPGGSHAWSAPKEVLRGLTVGAPPDIFNTKGQNWGLTNLSPRGLLDDGYGGFLATLRAAMRHAGGIRLDHAMGLQRLWVIPEGAGAADGVYLHYPLDALLGLTALESQRHRAMVIAEDLGTVPEGFREKLARTGILGMRVLWFERDAKGAFLPPSLWDAKAAALSTTHDLPTLAGWWSGRDLEWRRKLDLDAEPDKVLRQRAGDRKKLWGMLKKAGCARGPLPASPEVFADAAFAGLAATPARLKLLPVEDFVGQKEQPNIPGTIDEHPNWRRRLKSSNPLSTPRARRRAAILSKA